MSSMPSKNGAENVGPVRRSPRAPARVKVRFTDDTDPQDRRGKKRKYSNLSASENESNSAPVSPAPHREIQLELPVPVVAMSSTPRKRSSNSNRKKVDTYCWVCHYEGDDQKCAACPRVYHYQCLGPKKRFTEEGICPECRLQSTDGTELTESVKQKLPVVLPMVLNRISDKALPMFKTWSATETQNQKLVCIMDLSILQDRMSMEMPYKTTAAFLADVKWILHNCHIVFGAHDPYTNKARVLVNDCRNDLIDLEACVECYVRSHDANEDFARVCKVPHDLVWAKMKGFPFWPAKVLKVVDSIANVRFFGTHDKGKVPISHCYQLSESSPSEKMPKKANFMVALGEMEDHVQNFGIAFGTYEYSLPRVKYNPGDSNHLTKLNNKIQTPRGGHKAKNVKVAPKRPEPEEEPAMNSSTEDIIEITEPEESGTEHSSESNEIEIIEEQQIPKKTFMDNLSLFRSGNSSTLAIVNVNSHAYSEDQHALSSSILNNVEMEFCEDENTEAVANPSHFLPTPAKTLEEPPLSPEEVARNIVNEMLSSVDGTQEYEYQLESQSDISQTSTAEDISMQPDIQIVGGTSRGMLRTCHPHRVISDFNGVNLLVNHDEAYSTDMNASNFKAKYTHKFYSLVQDIIVESSSVMADMEKRNNELKEELDKHKQRSDEIKTNTDLIIKNVRIGAEAEKQKVSEIIKDIEEKCKKQIEIAEKKVQAVEEEKSKMKEDYEKKISELKASHESDLKKVNEQIEQAKEVAKMQWRKESQKTMDSARKKWKKDMATAISSVKRNQWCAYCLKEARFFCCWNTSYCNEDCQRNHWVQHVEHCENLCRNQLKLSAENAELLAAQAENGARRKKAENANGQLLPTLRPNGPQASRYHGAGASIAVSNIPLPASRPTIINAPQKSVITQTKQQPEATVPSPAKKVPRPPPSSPKPPEPKTPKE